MTAAPIETCREWVAGGRLCDAPADFLLWGQLFPRGAVGPRCAAHARQHLRGDLSADNIRLSAVLDLRGLQRIP